MAKQSKAESEFTRQFPHARVVKEKSGIHGIMRYTVFAGNYVCEQALSRREAFAKSLDAVERGYLQPDPDERA